MDRLDNRVRRGRQEAVDLMRAGDRLGFRAAVAAVGGSEPGEGGEGPVLTKRELDDVLFLGLRIGFWRVFREAIERHEAPALRLQPASPMRRRSVSDLGDGRSAGSRRGRHTPAHHCNLAAVCVANDRRGIVRKDTRHRRELPT
jgi:hypothetical protein